MKRPCPPSAGGCLRSHHRAIRGTFSGVTSAPQLPVGWGGPRGTGPTRAGAAWRRERISRRGLGSPREPSAVGLAMAACLAGRHNFGRGTSLRATRMSDVTGVLSAIRGRLGPEVAPLESSGDSTWREAERNMMRNMLPAAGLSLSWLGLAPGSAVDGTESASEQAGPDRGACPRGSAIRVAIHAPGNSRPAPSRPPYDDVQSVN